MYVRNVLADIITEFEEEISDNKYPLLQSEFLRAMKCVQHALARTGPCVLFVFARIWCRDGFQR